jgi:hypothetical protein
LTAGTTTRATILISFAGSGDVPLQAIEIPVSLTVGHAFNGGQRGAPTAER